MLELEADCSKTWLEALLLERKTISSVASVAAAKVDEESAVERTP